MANLIGQSLGRYHILEQLGEGGMAVVYKAYDTRMESDVAVKVIRTENLAPSILERALKRFEREAKALARLTHANIVKVLDYGEYEGKPYLVMPYLPGGTLKQLLNGQPIPWQDAARLLIPVARALGYAHSEGMIHRDVKPSNILITRSGDPMLTDFGIAKIIDEEMTIDLTGTSAAVGTPEYMAPEQVTSKTVDQRADIYALGIVLYEMVTGHKPFTADTPMAVLFKHASEPLPRPRSFVPDLPDTVERILIKALAKKKEDRYSNMNELAAALELMLFEKEGIQATLITMQENINLPNHTFDQSTVSQLVTPATTSSLGTLPRTEENHHAKRLTWPQAIAIGIGLAGALVLIALFVIGLPSLQRIFAAKPVPALTNTPILVFTEPPTLTQIAPSILHLTNTPLSTETSLSPTLTPVPPGYSLEDCLTSKKNICLYAINPQPDSVIIALKYKEGIDPSRLPYLSVGDNKFECEIWFGYPGRLYCYGPSISGDYRFTLRYSEFENICTGSFRINEFFVPAPPKKPGSSGGGTYP